MRLLNLANGYYFVARKKHEAATTKMYKLVQVNI